MAKEGFKDASSLLQAAVEAMDTGEMLTSSTFTLKEAMHGVEIMDEKMDAGMSREAVPQLLQRLQSGSVSMEDVSAEQVLNVMDRLFEMRASWAQGNSLPQTIFTCLFVSAEARCTLRHLLHLSQLPGTKAPAALEKLQPLKLGSRAYVLAFVLYAYICAFLREVYRACETVFAAQVFEDDDFVASTYGLDIGAEISNSYSVEVVHAAEAMLLTALQQAPDGKEKTHAFAALDDQEKCFAELRTVLNRTEPQESKKGQHTASHPGLLHGDKDHLSTKIIHSGLPVSRDGHPQSHLEEAFESLDATTKRQWKDSEEGETSAGKNAMPQSLDAVAEGAAGAVGAIKMLRRLRFQRASLVGYQEILRQKYARLPIAKQCFLAASALLDLELKEDLIAPVFTEEVKAGDDGDEDEISGSFGSYGWKREKPHVPRATLNRLSKVYGFDSELTSKMLVPSTPRLAPYPTWLEAVAYTHKTLDEMAYICNVRTLVMRRPSALYKPSATENSDNLPPVLMQAPKRKDRVYGTKVEETGAAWDVSLNSIFHLLYNFSSRDPNIIARSFLGVLLNYPSDLWVGRYPLSWLLEAAFLEYGLSEDDISTKECQTLLHLMYQTVSNTLKLLCFNRSKIRVRMKFVVKDWAAITSESEYLDRLFRAKGIHDQQGKKGKEKIPHVSSAFHWTLEQSLKLMILHLDLGLEQQVFAPYEMKYIYWYLEILHGELGKLQHQAEHNKAVAAAIAVYKKKLKNRRKGKLKFVAPAPQKTPAEAYLTFTRRLMCLGLIRHLLALEKEGLIVTPSAPTFSEKLVYEHRFRLFRGFRVPQLFPYEVARKAFDVKAEASALFQGAIEAFNLAKEQVMEGMKADAAYEKDFKHFFRVVLSNAVAADQAKQQLKGGKGKLAEQGLELETNHSIDDHFVVMRVKAQTAKDSQ